MAVDSRYEAAIPADTEFSIDDVMATVTAADGASMEQDQKSRRALQDAAQGGACGESADMP